MFVSVNEPVRRLNRSSTLYHMNDPARHNSAGLDEIPKTYESAVRGLTAAHAAGPDEVEIFSVPDPERKVVRLIEVSDAFPPGGVERYVPSGGTEYIVPVFPMGATNDFPFRPEVVLVTPAEWDQIRQGTLKLNRDWGDLKLAQQVGHAE